MNRKIDQKSVKQVVIDAGYHKLLKMRAAETGESIKELLESYLADLLAIKSDENGNNQ